MTGTAWRHKEASHVVFTGRKRTEMEVGAQLSFFSFLFLHFRTPAHKTILFTFREGPQLNLSGMLSKTHPGLCLLSEGKSHQTGNEDNQDLKSYGL